MLQAIIRISVMMIYMQNMSIACACSRLHYGYLYPKHNAAIPHSHMQYALTEPLLRLSMHTCSAYPPRIMAARMVRTSPSAAHAMPAPAYSFLTIANQSANRYRIQYNRNRRKWTE